MLLPKPRARPPNHEREVRWASRKQSCRGPLRRRAEFPPHIHGHDSKAQDRGGGAQQKKEKKKLLTSCWVLVSDLCGGGFKRVVLGRSAQVLSQLPAKRRQRVPLDAAAVQLERLLLLLPIKSKEVGSVRCLQTSQLLERRRLLVVPALAKHGILINFPTSSCTYTYSPLCKRRQHGLIKMQVHCQCKSCWRCTYSDPGVLSKDHYTRRIHLSENLNLNHTCSLPPP